MASLEITVRAPHPQPSAMKQRSGYEPSDTETEWHESPWYDHDLRNGDLGPSLEADYIRNPGPLKQSRRHSSRFEDQLSKASPARRRRSKSPYNPHGVDHGNIHIQTAVSDFLGNVSPVLPRSATDSRRNVSPYSRSESRRHISPYKLAREGQGVVDYEKPNSKSKPPHHQNNKNDFAEEQEGQPQVNEISRVSEKLNYSRRSLSAPRLRSREKEQPVKYGHTEQNGDRACSPLPRNVPVKESEDSHRKSPSVGELNEMVANAKISRLPVTDAPNFQSTDSIQGGDIFFSRDYSVLAMTMQKIAFPKESGVDSRPAPKLPLFTEVDAVPGNLSHSKQGNSSSTLLTRKTTLSSSAISRQSSGRMSTSSSNFSGISASFVRFMGDRRKNQKESWFSCIRKGSRKTSKSPEKNREIAEASFIERARVVESLRQFWADKHQPASLNGFMCHKQEAQVLKQLASCETFPHILLKGPPGSGKKSLTMALLREVFGDPSGNICHELKYIHVQETRPMQLVIPVTSSAHHVELNVHMEPNIRYALMALVKQISSDYAIPPEISIAKLKAHYKVLVLYEVDKATDSIQHLIKWIMDCYTESCKLILCCEDDADILQAVKSRCKIIGVDAPVNHEIIEVLIQIARKEDFELPMRFAAKVAAKSKHNLRKAIMALEACKAHNYPFVEDQPIPVGWERVIEEVAAEVLADPSQKRLFTVRGKFQKLLLDFVDPKLILLKLVEQFLKRVDSSLKREVHYWFAYYVSLWPS
ncbi:hypothetical protein NMG60_11026216 [Bertholletia excelsa]